MSYNPDFHVFYDTVNINDILVKGYQGYEWEDNPWRLVDGDPSKVGIKGSDCYRRDLRQSVSIKDRFTIGYMPHGLRNMFKRVRIGVGSKHIYVKGDFMKPHRDVRLPDLDGLPHVMTLVVLKTQAYCKGGELIINGTPTSSRFIDIDVRSEHIGPPPRMEMKLIVFPIQAIHEVTEITEGIRHSFAFPIYGEYNLYDRLTSRPKIQANTLYDNVLKELDEYIGMTTEEKISVDMSKLRGQILGTFETLPTMDCAKLFVRHRLNMNDYVPSEHNHNIIENDAGEYYDGDARPVNRICYTDATGKSIKEYVPMLSNYVIPDGSTGISIQGLKSRADDQSDDTILQRIREMIILERDAFIAGMAERQPAESKLNIASIPAHGFICVLAGMYYRDISPHNLFGVDSELYSELSQNRSITLTIRDVEELAVSGATMPIYINSHGMITPVTKLSELPESKFISEIHTEHDDQGGYDPFYTILHGIMIVGENV